MHARDALPSRECPPAATPAIPCPPRTILSFVMRGLDPRIHADATILIASRLIENLAAAWIAGSSPAMTMTLICSAHYAAAQSNVWYGSWSCKKPPLAW